MEQVIDKGPDWIEALGQLTPVVAIALLLVGIVVLYVYGQRKAHKSNLETIEVMNRMIVTPIANSHTEAVGDFKKLVENHLAHDAEDRRQHTEALSRQAEAFTELLACLREKEAK